MLPKNYSPRIAGERGWAGDQGQAVQASLNDPEYLWLDEGGTLFITDGDNHRVRQVTPDGVISTIAGIGSQKADDTEAKRSAPSSLH